MPCYSGDEDRGRGYYDDYLNERREREQRDAMLCAVLSALSPEALEAVLYTVDWKEAGVKKGQLLTWWEKHKVLDEERRVRERKAREKAAKDAAAKAEKEKVRKAAIAKLSPAERKALGLK